MNVLRLNDINALLMIIKIYTYSNINISTIVPTILFGRKVDIPLNYCNFVRFYNQNKRLNNIIQNQLTIGLFISKIQPANERKADASRF